MTVTTFVNETAESPNSARSRCSSFSSGTDSGVPRVEKLPYRDFVYDFQRKRRPVIITDATQDWPARAWTPEVLRRKAGHRQVEIRTQSEPESWLFEELIDLTLASTNHRSAPYARNIDVRRDLPELWPDIQPRLQYASPDWKSSKLLPKDFVFPNGLEELFFGGQGASFPRLHVDYWGMDGFVSQLYGRKEFILIDPSQTPFLYVDPADELGSLIDDIDNVDLHQFPLFSKVEPVRLMLQPGDTLYNPNGIWHTTKMPEVSLTVITAAWNSSNWRRFCRQYRLWMPGTKIHRAAVLGWLAAVGAVLGVRDRCLK
ncbi:MAG: cupin-like domain-containing protein [Rhodopirellula sp.]|nr:cupin-like domain-containing protein [Rhodopirellula sp.]